MDVSIGSLKLRRPARFHAYLAAVLLFGLVLRLHGIHDPILDHPGWRQGDTAAIARNFARLDMNPFHPQVDYDGPPPNYVELELQIVPYLAALLYKLFGIHEIFGRLISIAFSLGAIAVLGFFGRRLFASEAVGIFAAFFFATYPGSAYYGRTFTPDTAMAFFLSAALYATLRWLDRDEVASWNGFWPAAILFAVALLAKPVAAVGLIPAFALMAARWRTRVLLQPQAYAFFAIAVLPYAGYDAYLRSIAEWHWASGIAAKHVLPSLRESFESLAAFRHKLAAFRDALGLLWATMLGPFYLVLFVLAIAVPVAQRTRTLLYAWLAAALAYAYVVVTVEHVDYYLYPVLPLAALWTAASLVRALESVPQIKARVFTAAPLIAAAVGALALPFAPAPVRAYYHYGKPVYRAARALDASLAPGSLVVMGHYDPSVLYYIDRKGWEEDPYLWTPFDEQSAIRKGARYFIAIERRRLERNVELYAWLQRFPIVNPDAMWPVYETDYAKVLPGADARWRAFRHAEKTHAPPMPPP